MVPATVVQTTIGPTTTTSPPLGLEEVARFQPIDPDPSDLQPTGPITGFDIDDDVLAYANGPDGEYAYAVAGEFDTSRLTVFPVGGIGYFAAGWDGLYIFDLTDPAAPALLGHWKSPDWIIRVVVADGTAYVTMGDSGFAVLDVIDPASPRLLGAVDVPGFATQLDVAQGHAFVGWLGDGGSLGGVAVIDLSDPESPVFVDTFGRFPSMTGLRVAGDRVFVSDEIEDIVVLRMTGLG